MKSWGCALLLSLAVAPSVAMSAESSTPAAHKVSVYGHRGASALLPEHTLAAYAQAIADGADYIEPDLVMTKDGVMVARHENEIGGTTDVASHPEFASRRTSKVIDGQNVDGWFTEDFTLAELKTLYARERLPELRSTAYDGQFRIASLDEILAFLVQQAGRANRGIGLVPEIKHPTYFQSIGLPMEDKLLARCGNAYTNVGPVTIQSFETANLRYLRGKIPRGSNIRLLQLLWKGDTQPADIAKAGGTLTYAQMMTPAGLKDIASYADSIGPELRSIIPLDDKGALGTPTTLVRDAHAVGLMVIPYTFRPENRFQASNLRKGPTTRAMQRDRSPKCVPTWPPASMPSSPTTRHWAGRRWMARARQGTERSTPPGMGRRYPGCRCAPVGANLGWHTTTAPTKVGHYWVMRLPASGRHYRHLAARLVRPAERDHHVVLAFARLPQHRHALR